MLGQFHVAYARSEAFNNLVFVPGICVDKKPLLHFNISLKTGDLIDQPRKTFEKVFPGIINNK